MTTNLSTSAAGSGLHAPPKTDDRVLPATRLLAVLVIPFLVVAAAILLIFPDRTGELFAWPIQPPMTAMMLGSAYLGGIYFFTRVALAQRWHTVAAGFLPVTVFASLLGIATAIHWDRFTQGHVAFWAWAGLYFTAPFLVLAAWLVNRRLDPGRLPGNPRAPGDPRLPRGARLVLGLAGGATLLISLLLFLWPEWMMIAWPWKLSPLTARVVGAMFALPGVLGVEFMFDPRWSAMRRILEAQALSILAILASAARDWGSMDLDRAAPYVFVLGMVGFLAGIVFLYLFMQARSKDWIE